MLKVKKVVGSILSSNMYVLFEESSSDCWVVDVGDFHALKEALPISVDVKGLFLTHGHFDHIAGINDFHKSFPEAKIYLSDYGKEQLYSDRKNFSFYHEKSIIYSGNENSLSILRDGNIIAISDSVVMQVIATPGHCSSCLTYYTDKYIFTGDSYIPNAPIVTKLPKGDRTIAKESLRNILLHSNKRIILGGHDVKK